jgi:hypothetical protein
VAQLPAHNGEGDDAHPPRGSNLMLFDRGRPFGLPHFMHVHIATFGAGRFAHWRDTVLFSTPDGSDPNTDPSRWSYCPEY